MILTAIVGNRILSFALFAQEENEGDKTPIATVQIAAQPARTADEYAALLSALLSQKNGDVDVKISIVASVVPPLTDVIIKAIRQLYQDCVCLSVGAGLRTGFTIRTDAPGEVGADLVALTAGALALREPPFLILDCGAITTLSAVGKGKNAPEFLGCAILPGPALCADALKKHAAQLPNVSLKRPVSPIGTNTGDSMRAGLLLGFSAAIQGLASTFAAEMGAEELPLIVTGEGDEVMQFAPDVMKEYDTHLAHRGLYRLALLNARKSGNAPKRG